MSMSKHACTELGRILETEIKESIESVSKQALSVKLSQEDQDAIVGIVINTIEDKLCS